MSGGADRSRGGGGRTKSGKPRPGTGGYGKRRLEGKGPTPPAQLRPGHPAQRRAAAAARDQSRRGPARRERAAPGDDGRWEDTGRDGSGGGPAAPGPAAGEPGRARGAGEAPEVIAGRNAVLEALRAGVPVTALYAAPRGDSDQRVREAVGLAAAAGIPMIEAGRGELDRLTRGAIHQGLALRVRGYDYCHPADLTQRARHAGQVPLIVALDGVTDPRNLGAIARSAAAFGAHGVVIPARRSAPVTAGAWKASAGALARVPVARAANLVRALAAYQEEGLFVVGLDSRGPDDVAGMDIADGPLVLVAGSEGRGLSRLTAQRCDLLARIRITSAAESLNAGVAVGIALYEVIARRAGRGHGAPVGR